MINPLSFTPQSLALKIVASVLAVLILISVVWFGCNHLISVGYDKRVAEEQVEANKELVQAAAETQRLQQKLNEAERELQVAKNALDKLSAANAITVGKLRDSINSYNRSLSNNSRQALEERIKTLSVVFGECTERYAEVAKHADGHQLDTELLENAWAK